MGSPHHTIPGQQTPPAPTAPTPGAALLGLRGEQTEQSDPALQKLLQGLARAEMRQAIQKYDPQGSGHLDRARMLQIPIVKDNAADLIVRAEIDRAAVGFNGIPTPFVMDDAPVLDERSLSKALAGLSLPVSEVRDMLHHAFPHGIDQVMLSDVCRSNLFTGPVGCTPIGPHRILVGPQSRS